MSKVTTVEVSENLSGVFVPDVNDSYFIKPENEELFKRLDKLSTKSTQKVLLQGPHGAGKTEMAMQYAAIFKKPILIMDCANLKEPRDWFGYKTIENGEVRWHVSQFDKALSRGNHVILLDEINRVHPAVLNTLIPLLDGRGFTYLEEKGECIRVGQKTVIFASMNEGAGYTGTNATDLALRDRFSRIVEVSYLDKEKEVELLCRRTEIDKKNAEKLVDIARQIRSKAAGLDSSFSMGFSTRQLIAVAEDFCLGGVESLTFTMSNLFTNDGGTSSERAAVMQLIQGKFGSGEDAARSKMKGV